MPVIIFQQKSSLFFGGDIWASLHKELYLLFLMIWTLALKVGHILTEALNLILLQTQTLRRFLIVPLTYHKYGIRLFNVVIQELKCKLFADIVLALNISFVTDTL